jgi:hypothetical protein
LDEAAHGARPAWFVPGQKIKTAAQRACPDCLTLPSERAGGQSSGRSPNGTPNWGKSLVFMPVNMAQELP